MKGFVFLRSSDYKLPDLVFDLHGPVYQPIDVEVSARIDSVKGALRATVEGIPDAPVSRFVLKMQGGRKGLIVNSRNLCKGVNRASVRLTAHNGKRRILRPVVRASCKKQRKAKRGHRRHRRR